jgi:hypothetical protein
VDALAPTGARVCVVDPRKTKLKAGFAAKTDRLDARRLADALRRESVVSIYVPPPAIRELRELCRGRHQVIRLRSRVSQMIRALLLRSGVADVPVRRVFSGRGLAWLEQVALPPAAAATLQRLRRLLAAIHEEAAAAEQAVATAAASDAIARAGRSWPATPAWCRAWTRVPIATGRDALRRKGRRGCDGRWWKRRCITGDGRMRGAGGVGSWRYGKAGSRPASPSRGGCVTTSWPRGHRGHDVLSTSGAPTNRMTHGASISE